MKAGASEEVARAYGEFERAANAELEKSVGAAISRVMEQALPNLRTMQASGEAHRQAGAQGAAPLQERLAGAVREEVESALKNDRQLGEQVGKILSGRRFDNQSRAQVVRLIDVRAQQLVPGAVKRVVSAWTQATLPARGKANTPAATRKEEPVRLAHRAATAAKDEPITLLRDASNRNRRLDYGKLSDEEILGL